MPLLFAEPNKILFVHIPKTGGTAIEYWLDQIGVLALRAYNPRSPFECSPQHLTLRDIQFLFGAAMWDYAFTIVRNPYDRAESEFCYQHRHALAQGRQLLNFGTWLEDQIDAAIENPYHLDNHIRPQTEFIGPNVEIFRYEDGLNDIVQRVAATCGLDAPPGLTHVQKRAGTPYFDWSAPLIKKFNEYYKLDFDCLNYSKRPIISC